MPDDTVAPMGYPADALLTSLQPNLVQSLPQYSNLSLESSIESLPANAIKNGAFRGKHLEIDLDSGTILSSDGITNRVLISQGVMKVSKKGYEVTTATIDQLLFNGDQ